MSFSIAEHLGEDIRRLDDTTGAVLTAIETTEKVSITAEEDIVSGYYEDTSAVMGINPASGKDKSLRGVRFSAEINVYEVPAFQSPFSTNVTFSDKIVDMDDEDCGNNEMSKRRKKRVRFSCLKHPRQPLSHGLSLLQLLKRHTLGPTPNASVTAKKRVQFGALKCQKTRRVDLDFGQPDSEWDEAETRRVFKRECVKHMAMQPLSSASDASGND